MYTHFAQPQFLHFQVLFQLFNVFAQMSKVGESEAQKFKLFFSSVTAL